MTRLTIDNEFKGDLGEFYFKRYCNEHGYAYIKLEDIYNTLTPKGELEFKKGFARIIVKIPDEIIPEIHKVCKPNVKSTKASPSFVFDFLTCQMHKETDFSDVKNKLPRDFVWVEIKTGTSELSANQLKTAEQVKLRFAIFRIFDVDVPPRYIEIEWEGEKPSSYR